MNSPTKKLVHVIAHTHWDRSWYWPFERFRVKLIDCVKAVVSELKADEGYRFNFDGQVMMLDDYLQICPEDAEYLRQCALENRIKIGPMYCLSDVYCTGGEALIRNLLQGRKWCDTFGGGYSRVLHMPDTFGIIPEMPMISAGFGFSAFTFMRGVAGQVPGLVTMENIQGIKPQIPDDCRWFHWSTPDGSRIVAIRLLHGYASAAAIRMFERNTGEINFERYVDRLKEAAREWDSPAHEVVMLMAGVDHMVPWKRQGEAQIKASNATDYDYQFSTLEKVATALAATPSSDWPECHHEEFHGSGAASVLGGTISTRIYLKQNNAAIEQLLVHQVEPAMALAKLLGQNDPAFAAVDHAWRTLLATHPHDDICGCSVDSVHQKNESDMQQSWECADALRRRAYLRLLQRFSNLRTNDSRPSFVLMNFQGVERNAPSRIKFDYEGQRDWGDIKLPDSYRIVDASDNVVPFREISRGMSVEHPRLTTQLEIHCPLPPFTPCRFFIEETPFVDAPISEPPVTLTAENAYLRVTLHRDGSFDITRKSTGETCSRLGYLSSESDIGDSYDFSDVPGATETVFTGIDCDLELRQWPGGLVELIARGELSLPSSVDSISRTPSSEMVLLPFTQTLVLAPGATQLEVGLSFTNTASDHRLRWNVHCPKPTKTALVGMKFLTMRRPVGSRPEGDMAPRIFPEHPMDQFVAVDGLAVFSDFPRNYEVVSTSENDQRLAITICRSMSYLTNPTQGATRPGINAGPHTLTPEARCLGRSFVQYLALRPFNAEEEKLLMFQAHLWRAAPFAGQTDATMSYPESQDESVEESSFLQVNKPVLVSAFKPATSGEGIVLRLANPTSLPVEATVKHRFPGGVRATLLDEMTPDTATSLILNDHLIQLSLPPFSLRTLRFE